MKIISMWPEPKDIQKIKNVTSLATYYVALCFVMIALWINRKFGEPSFEQIVFHMQFGTEGLLDADEELTGSFLRNCIYFPIILALLFLGAEKTLLNNIFGDKTWCSNNAIFRLSGLVAILKKIGLPFIFFVIAFVFTLYKIAFFPYLNKQLGLEQTPREDFYAVNYIEPSPSLFTVEKPKNLILIYVESLENAYASDDLFGKELISDIQPANIGGQSFSKFIQVPGTGWTMAGIVSSQCGIPLRPLIGAKASNSSIALPKVFLPNIKCLGDILESHHYKNIFIGGASLSFAGKGKFFKDHGYHELYGKEELEKLEGMALNHWGVFDNDLLKFAKTKIDQLEQSGQLYNLTLLTLDTHQPKGYLSEECKKNGATNFPDIVECSSKKIAELVNYIKSRNYQKNTTIVIMGDHLSMINTEHDKLVTYSPRTVFNNFISSDSDLQKTREGLVHFDVFPTILDSIGIRPKNGKLALGTSGFYQGETISFEHRLKYFNDNLLNYSPRYQKFWVNY